MSFGRIVVFIGVVGDVRIIEDMKLDIPNIAEIFVMELVKTLQEANVFDDDKVATYADRLNVNL